MERAKLLDELDGDDVSRYVDGDLDAFTRLFRQYGRDVYSVCLRILHNNQDAEDVTSEVFYELWTRRDRFDGGRATLRNYLMILARSRAVDRYRAQIRQGLRSTTSWNTSLENHEPTQRELDHPSDQIDRAERQQLARQALSRLDDVQRQSLELVYFEGLSHSQIATRLDVPLGTVKSHIRRGLEKLRSFLKSSQPGGGV